LTLAAPAAGRVQRIAIREGAPVAAGQVLAVVSSERQSLAGDTSSAVLSQLATQRTRLGSEIADAEQLAVQQRSGLAQRMASLRAQLHSLEQQRLLAREQAAQSAALLARIAPLGDKGYVSVFEIARQRSAKLEAKSQVKALDRQLIELRQQLAATQDQFAQLPLNLASQRSGLQRQRAGIEQALAQAEAERAAVIRAPRAGRVTSVLAVEGQPVVAGQALLALAPDGVPLEAELLVPSAAAGFVRAGQLFSDNKVRPIHTANCMILGHAGCAVPAKVLPLLHERTGRLLRIMLRLWPVDADLKVTRRGCGRKLGLVKQRARCSCGIRLGCCGFWLS
ncbi:MAG: HlyD family secretion protein, partial [Acidobacteriaceae bacterium]